MASGGMGDLLSGIIAGLVAQNVSAIDAANLGVCIHAMAADASAQLHGERGTIASDLLPYVRHLVNNIAPAL
jgi:NAD(P)H-hydrate epimerase